MPKPTPNPTEQASTKTTSFTQSEPPLGASHIPPPLPNLSRNPVREEYERSKPQQHEGGPADHPAITRPSPLLEQTAAASKGYVKALTLYNSSSTPVVVEVEFTAQQKHSETDRWAGWAWLAGWLLGGWGYHPFHTPTARAHTHCTRIRIHVRMPINTSITHPSTHPCEPTLKKHTRTGSTVLPPGGGLSFDARDLGPANVAAKVR